MTCIFDCLDILVRASHADRFLNAACNVEGRSQDVREIRGMFWKGQPPGQAEVERVGGQDSNSYRIFSSRNETRSDEAEYRGQQVAS